MKGTYERPPLKDRLLSRIEITNGPLDAVLMTSSDDYWWHNHPPSQAEKREVIRNDCMMTRAQADADLLNQGRFKKETATTVTGSGGAPTYPRQPSGPWAHGDPGAPDPATNELGYPIDELEPILPPTSPPSSPGDIGTEAAEKASPLVASTHAAAVTNPPAAAAREEVLLPASSQPHSRKRWRRRF